MMIPNFANNANDVYEKNRIAHERQDEDFSYAQHYFIKLIEWGCVAFTILMIAGKLCEWIDNTTLFATIDNFLLSLL